MNRKITLLVIVLLVLSAFFVLSPKKQESSEYVIGYISSMTGPVAKYGAYEAGKLAMEHINENGGINGKPLRIIFEDGKCNGVEAVNAMNKLINIDKVDIVLGGHCSPESVAIASVAEKNKVIMLASISSSPALSNAGKYVFRTTPVSTTQSGLLADFVSKELKLKKFAVIYEITDYAKPIAESFKDSFVKNGGEVSLYEGYPAGTTDFRTILTKVKNSGVDGILISPQSPEASLNIMKQIKELGIKNMIFGNDAAANQVNIDSHPSLYEGLIVATPAFDVVNNPKTKAFVEEYNKRFNTKALPYGVWTAESYDAVKIIAEGLSKYGDDVEKIRTYLSRLSNYSGVSGTITINEHGDGVRDYILRIVKDGKITNY